MSDVAVMVSYIRATMDAVSIEKDDSVPPSIQEPAQEFTCFPKLPIELRLKIWECHLPGPRIIEIYEEERLYGTKPFDFEVLRNIFSSPKLGAAAHSPILGVLRACHESREVLLSKYEKVSAAKFQLSDIEPENIDYSAISSTNLWLEPNMRPHHSFLVNWERDAIFFNINWDNRNAILANLDKDILKRIRKVAFRVGSIVGKANRMDMAYAFTSLRGLE